MQLNGDVLFLLRNALEVANESSNIYDNKTYIKDTIFSRSTITIVDIYGINLGINNICLDTDSFLRILKVLSKESAYDIYADDNNFIVKDIDRKSIIKLSIDDVPLNDDISFVPKDIIEYNISILDGLKLVSDFLDVKELLPYFRSIYVKDNDIVCGNSRLLARYNLLTSTDGKEYVIDGIGLLKILPALKQDIEKCYFSADGKYFCVDNGIAKIYILLIDIPYIDYKSIFNQADNGKILFETFIDDAEKGIIDDFTKVFLGRDIVTLSFCSDGLDIIVNNDIISWVTKFNKPIFYNAENIAVKFRIELDTLRKVLKYCNKIQFIQINSNQDIIMLRGFSEENNLIILGLPSYSGD